MDLILCVCICHIVCAIMRGWQEHPQAGSLTEGEHRGKIHFSEATLSRQARLPGECPGDHYVLPWLQGKKEEEGKVFDPLRIFSAPQRCHYL